MIWPQPLVCWNRFFLERFHALVTVRGCLLNLDGEATVAGYQPFLEASLLYDQRKVGLWLYDLNHLIDTRNLALDLRKSKVKIGGG